MGLFKLFISATPYRVFISILMGAFAGIAYSALIPLVMVSITPADPLFPEVEAAKQTFLSFEVSNYAMAGVYLLACIAILITRSLSEIILLHAGAIVAKNIRTRFYKSISQAPVSAIEQIGSSKLIAAVNLDVPRIVIGARLIPSIFVNLITLIGMLGFLLYLNTDIFKLVLFSIIAGIVVYQLPMMFGRRIFERNREVNDALQEGIKGLIYGVKELKLDKNKRDTYYDKVLLAHEKDLVQSESRGHTVMRSTISLGDLLSFFVIGFITFISVNYYVIERQELVGVIMALLYITTPIAIVLNSLPGLTIAGVSLAKIHRLMGDIPKESVEDKLAPLPSWQAIEFKDVMYQYPSKEDEKGFGIGPINLRINRGETTFIVGGNGSGKSTLSKLITQHYQHSEGDVFFGETEITAEKITAARQQVYAIYSNYYLFDQLLMDITPEAEAKIQDYLKAFRLDSKVSIVDGHFSTTSLSDGQRKRLALLVGLLDDKALYLFDEWAADQDPDFKDIFYMQILPELKAQGKAVVAISHDDHYFHAADRVLKMDNGHLSDVTEAMKLAKSPAEVYE